MPAVAAIVYIAFKISSRLPTSISSPRSCLQEPTPFHNLDDPQLDETSTMWQLIAPSLGIHTESHMTKSIHQTLPPQLAETTETSIMGAWAPSTRSTYATGLPRFNQFRDKWSIPESMQLPVSYVLLCAFIGKHEGTVSKNIIKLWLSSVGAFHLVNRREWFGDDSWVWSPDSSGFRKQRGLLSQPTGALFMLTFSLSILWSYDEPSILPALFTPLSGLSPGSFGCRRLGEIVL
jgi:hypothetical protein